MRPVTLRPYAPADEEAAIELWRRSWQAAYPGIDFAARVGWWRQRWRDEITPAAAIVIAESEGRLVGFVTVDRASGHLDQLVVAPEAWGGGAAALLMARAKALAPGQLVLHVNQDNARALRFYRKHGFVTVAADRNQNSGNPVFVMRWRR